jgi:hypothetical protein
MPGASGQLKPFVHLICNGTGIREVWAQQSLHAPACRGRSQSAPRAESGGVSLCNCALPGDAATHEAEGEADEQRVLARGIGALLLVSVVLEEGANRLGDVGEEVVRRARLERVGADARCKLKHRPGSESSEPQLRAAAMCSSQPCSSSAAAHGRLLGGHTHTLYFSCFIVNCPPPDSFTWQQRLAVEHPSHQWRGSQGVCQPD